MEEEIKYYLYKITNRVNGKMYIGITKNPNVRKNQHWNFEKRFNGKSISILYQAMRKYGKDSFEFSIICIGSKSYILDLETKVISLYRTQEKHFGYNIKPGGEAGRGYSIKTSKRDKPTFVSGFWFPSRRLAIEKLGWPVDLYKRRQKDRTLGLLQTFSSYGTFSKYKPYYVAGFWFPDIKIASEMLCRSELSLISRIRRGSVEEKFKRRSQDKELNHMFGISPENHPSSKKVSVLGEVFPSIKQATDKTGLSKYIITTRIKEGHPDFFFLTEETK